MFSFGSASKMCTHRERVMCVVCRSVEEKRGKKSLNIFPAYAHKTQTCSNFIVIL